MIPEPELPITLRPSFAMTVFLLLISILFVTIGIFMVLSGEVRGYLVGGVFALGIPVFALQFHPRASYLRLDQDGFTFASLFREHTVRWSQVGDFGVVRVGLNPMVAWNYRPGHPLPESVRHLSRALFGYEAALPDTYGMKPQDLANLMNGLRRTRAR